MTKWSDAVPFSQPDPHRSTVDYDGEERRAAQHRRTPVDELSDWLPRYGCTRAALEEASP